MVHFHNSSLDLRICRSNPKVVLSRLVSRRLFLTGFWLLFGLVAPFETLIGLLLRRPCIADQIGCSIEGENLYFEVIFSKLITVQTTFISSFKKTFPRAGWDSVLSLLFEIICPENFRENLLR